MDEVGPRNVRGDTDRCRTSLGSKSVSQTRVVDFDFLLQS